MKSRHLIWITAVVVFSGGVWFWLHPHSATGRPHKMHLHYPWTPEEKQLMDERMAAIASDDAHDWKSSIDFQGLVVDQDTHPLPKALVTWETTTVYGNGNGTTVSDGNGRFSIETTGKVMDVQVTKDGYDTLDGHQGFEFADFTDPIYYDSDKEHPVVFHLHKIPPYEPIYIWGKSVEKNLVGVKTFIDPITGKVSQNESSKGMWVEITRGPDDKPDQQQYNVVLGTSAGGGVHIADQNSYAIAPESNYTTPVDANQTIGFKGSGRINLRAFFKDGAGNYGLFDFNIGLYPNPLLPG